MARRKRKLTPAEKKRRRREYMTIFIGGKQKRVKRPPTIDGMDVDEFIRRNASRTNHERLSSVSRPLYAGRDLRKSPGIHQIYPRRTSRTWSGRHLSFQRPILDRFTFVRLSDAHLSEFSSHFSSNAHHHGF